MSTANARRRRRGTSEGCLAHGGPGLAVGEDAHQLAEHHGEGVGARAGGVVEKAVPHVLDGALLGLDELGRDGAQPLDEAADLAMLRVGAGPGLRLGGQGQG